jgi:hypothetical protein
MRGITGGWWHRTRPVDSREEEKRMSMHLLLALGLDPGLQAARHRLFPDELS